MPFVAVLHVSKTPPSHLIEHFDEVCEDYYQCSISPECYNNPSSVFYNLNTALEYNCYDDADEMYKFLSDNVSDIEYEEV